MSEQAWQTDWQEFVHLMAQLFASGSLESEVSDKFRGQRVCWRGTVGEVATGPKHDAPGIVMVMPAAPVRLSGDRQFVGTHLWLPVRNQIVKAKEGDVIAFDATIKRNSILDPIRFVEDHSQNKVVLLTSLDEIVLRSD